MSWLRWYKNSSYTDVVRPGRPNRPFINNPFNTNYPISFPSLSAALAALPNAPSDANYVMWNNSWTNLEQAFRAMSAGDILVLPERAEPYWVLSDWGFPAAGVGSIRGLNQTDDDPWLPVSTTWNGMFARTWFAMARARRGIIGLGPGAVIQTTNSGWNMPAQIQDAGSVESNGWVSLGRHYRDTSGVKKNELVGAQEKIIESTESNSYFGNFTMKSRDFGGIAYSGIATVGGVIERVHGDGSWRGFQGVPNGETGAVSSTGGTYLISRCTFNPRDELGARVGSSPVMINSSSSGRLENITANMTRIGMPTLWNCSGRHEIINLEAKWGAGPGLNLERVRSGAHIYIEGGALWPNRANQGGKGSPPDGVFGNGLHINLGLDGPITLEVVDVDLDYCVAPDQLSIQGYANTPVYKDASTIIHRRNGVDRAWRIY